MPVAELVRRLVADEGDIVSACQGDELVVYGPRIQVRKDLLAETARVVSVVPGLLLLREKAVPGRQLAVADAAVPRRRLRADGDRDTARRELPQLRKVCGIHLIHPFSPQTQ